MPRYSGWRRLSGETADRPDLLDLGKRLLGYLAEQRALSGNTTLSIERKTADGSIVRARFVGDLPQIEVIAAKPGGEARPNLLQGFVIHPDIGGTLNDALLLPGGRIDETHRRWASLFFDAAHFPDPIPVGAGIYSHNRGGQAIFADGLTAAGNLDWRNQDESLVVSFFGCSDRYFGQIPGGMVTRSNWSNLFNTLVFINGDVVMDFADHADYNDFDDVVLGACIRGGKLVWCIGSNGGSYLKFYMAPLKPRPEFRWMQAPPPAIATQFTPRFQRVDFTQAALLYQADLDPDMEFQIDSGHLFAFNQSATEGRMLLWRLFDVDNDRGAFEVVFNFERLDEVAFSVTKIESEDVTVEGSGSFERSVVIQAYQAGSRQAGASPGDPDVIRYFWDYADRSYHIKSLVTDNTSSFVQPKGICAVDYKDDVPVYGYMVRSIIAHQRKEYSADPVTTPEVPAAYGSGFHNTNAASASLTLSGNNIGLDLPWGLNVTPTFTVDINEAGTSDSRETPTGFTASSTVARTRSASNDYLIPFYCDLRYDTLIYGLVSSTVEVDYPRTTSAADSFRSESVTTTTRLLRKVRLVAHMRGADVWDSGTITIQDDTSSDTVTDDDIGGGTAYAGWDVGISLVSTDTGGINYAGEAFDPFFSSSGYPVTDALEAAIGFPAGIVGSTTPLNLSTVVDTSPAPSGGSSATERNPSRPSWFRQRGPWEDDDSFIGAGWLFGGGSEPIVILDWGYRSLEYSMPLADGGTYTFNRPAYGFWQTLQDAYAFSMPWPNGSSERFHSVIGGGDFAERVGASDTSPNYPIWTTTRFCYQRG